ncbi:hypothetical protein BU23DRAFT_567711 [Bimuria novae-zelandiae CBS 107.79]|uniref:Uncharacterized protein n=1 Tax=Bimuria novae-zelandiae CBS 107.79 TaxID=1447943 RepID=A0A6A5V9W6_9PLEO|nr:hypothetical protein BU23DRAFT_567711 [Bimuria novae-zelandiae CBS 107.79]
MAEPIDLASMIRTWVAAALAIIALFGVVGPWLVWRNLRSERNLALTTVNYRSSKFVSKGIRIKDRAYALKKVTVPYLSEPPKLRGFARKEGPIPDIPSRTGWIALLETMDALSLPQPKGGELIFKDRDTWLPVHKLWLLVLGLLARSGDRDDRGQAIARTFENASRLDHDHLGDSNDGLAGIIGVWNSVARPNTHQLYFTPYN